MYFLFFVSCCATAQMLVIAIVVDRWWAHGVSETAVIMEQDMEVWIWSSACPGSSGYADLNQLCHAGTCGTLD